MCSVHSKLVFSQLFLKIVIEANVSRPPHILYLWFCVNLDLKQWCLLFSVRNFIGVTVTVPQLPVPAHSNCLYHVPLPNQDGNFSVWRL